MKRLALAASGLAACVLLVGMAGSREAVADDPRPTSHFGSMPNGWAGYSLLQHGQGNHGQGNHGQGNHGHGHHGHGHHGHGHHGHGHHGHGHHGHGHGHGHGHHGGVSYGYGVYHLPIGGFCPGCLQLNCFNPYCGLYTTSGIGFSYGVPSVVVAPSPWVQRWQALQLQQIAAAAAVGGANQAAVRQPPQQNGIPAAGVRAAAAGMPEGAEEIRRRVSVLRESKPGGRQRADRLIAMADRYFADQDYRRAASKYRQALTQAADYSNAHFRLGHAYVATGDLELALTYFLMGLELSGSVERDGFSLDDMYRGNNVAKQTHIDTLSDAALRQPDDGGLLMLVGMSLHYDGEPLRARSFFEQAARLPGPQQTYARMFFPAAALEG